MVVIDCNFTENVASLNRGGLFVLADPKLEAKFESVVFKDNYLMNYQNDSAFASTSRGGIFYITAASSLLLNNITFKPYSDDLIVDFDEDLGDNALDSVDSSIYTLLFCQGDTNITIVNSS